MWTLPRLSDGGVQFVLYADSFDEFALETSTNLTHWVQQTKLVIPTDGTYRMVVDDTSAGQRFYRARYLPDD